MGFLHNYLGLEPAYKDGYDLPLLGIMKSLHRDRPGAGGFRSGHQGHAFRYHGVPEYAQRRGAVMSSEPSKIRVAAGPEPSRCVNLICPVVPQRLPPFRPDLRSGECLLSSETAAMGAELPGGLRPTLVDTGITAIEPFVPPRSPGFDPAASLLNPEELPESGLSHALNGSAGAII